jgi:hypothetical protein
MSTCISPSNVGAIPANNTFAEAVPKVAVVGSVSRDSGLAVAATPEGIGLSSGPLPIMYTVTFEPGAAQLVEELMV